VTTKNIFPLELNICRFVCAIVAWCQFVCIARLDCSYIILIFALININ